MVAARLIECHLVCLIWSRIERILCSQHADTSIRCLTSLLLDPSCFAYQDLPELTKLHVSSARHLMTTMKLLAPAAFPNGSPDPDLFAVAHLDGYLADMMSVLIDLQVFHLQRALALTAHKRQRLCWMKTAGAAADIAATELFSSPVSSADATSDEEVAANTGEHFC